LTYLPTFIDEFTGETNLVTDCVPASGLMGINKQTHSQYPATATERESLQNAMGTQDAGAGTDQLAAGIKSLYRIITPTGNSWTAVVAALKNPKQGVALLGAYAKLPLAIRNHGRQPTFNGLHAMYVQCLDPAIGSVTYGDPLATSFGTAHIADFQAYFAGLPMYALFTEEEPPVLVPKETFSPARKFTVVGGTATAAVSIDGFSIDLATGAIRVVKTTKWSATSGATAIAALTIGGKKYLQLPVGSYMGPYVIDDEVHIKLAVAPDATPFDQADIAAAVATAIAPLNKRIANAKTALG